jgi:mRNA deadenylase 3'-5' endonuclease subunit Ccr4
MKVTSQVLPFQRRFLATDVKPDTDIGSFSVMTWNVLAQSLARRDKHAHALKGALKRKSRIPLIIEEIRKIQADIVCLQEIDFIEEIQRGLSRDYGCAIYQRKGSGKLDGSVIFYRLDKFNCVATDSIKYGPQLLDSVGVLALLQTHMDSTCVIVGTTHLYWKPGYEGIRLRQISALMNATRKLQMDHGESIPIVISGDFNTAPGGPVCKYMTGEGVDLPCSEMSTIPNSRLGKDLPPHTTCPHLKSPVPNLVSAYSTYKDISLDTQMNGPLPSDCLFVGGSRDTRLSISEPDFTTFTSFFASTIDYIYYSSNSLHVTSVLEIPPMTVASLEKGALPSRCYPSDHISLVARFQLRK